MAKSTRSIKAATAKKEAKDMMASASENTKSSKPGRKPKTQNSAVANEQSSQAAQSKPAHTYLSGYDNKKKTGRAPGTPGEHETKEGPLYKFFHDSLKDIYYAEQKLTQALQKMADSATTEELKDAFTDHKTMTQRQITRLEKVFRLIEETPQGKQCEAIDGIIKEGESIIEDTEEGTMTRDAALIMAAQKAEHYEIATYGGLVALAHTLSLPRVADLLQTTLDEEDETDKNLTDIAESHINFDALEDEDESEKEDDDE